MNATELLYHRFFWLSVILFACVLAWFRRLPLIVFALICILTVEFISLAMHPYVVGATFQPQSPLIGNRFIPHPLLQGIPKHGTFASITNTQDNLRRTINSDKAPDAERIFVYGGSTTYDVAVGDESTWPSVLSGLLGPHFVVYNHAVPGYTTVENIIQASFEFRTAIPRCAVFYLGWNDIRSNGLADLNPDYSNYHLLGQPLNLGIVAPTNIFARRSAFFSIIFHVMNERPRAKGTILREYDPRLSQIFSTNVKLIATIARHFDVRPIFIPQVMDYGRLTALNAGPWTPLVLNADVKKLLSAMNADLVRAAGEADAPVTSEVLDVSWNKEDFVDPGHFSPQGSRKSRNRYSGACCR